MAPPPNAERFDVDDVPGGRPSTMRLVGGFIAIERGRRRLSAEVFMEQTTKSVAWLHAVERGEVLLTHPMLDLLGVAFGRHGEWIDITKVVRTLESDPYGSLARRLRSSLSLPIEFDPLEGSGAVVADGAVPVVSSIDSEDRLLILGPIVLVAILVRVVVAIAGWVNFDRDVDLDLAAEALVAGGLIGLIVVALPTVDSILRWLAIMSRTPKVLGRSLRYAETRLANGLPSAFLPNSETPRQRAVKGRIEWFTPRDQPYLMTGARTVAWRSGLVADFYERLWVLLFLPTIVAAGSLIAALVVGEDRWPVAAVVTAITVALLIAGRSCGVQAGRQALAGLSRGCGLKVERRPEPDPEPAETSR